MNIFAYDPCPYKSALWLDDVRKNKMILESAQMLSTAMNILCPDHGEDVYKSTHPQHPSNVWARASRQNFIWLLSTMESMQIQRGGKHKSYRLIPLFRKFASNSSNFSKHELTPFANCARNKELGIDYSHIPNTHAAYRLYTRDRWKVDTIKLTWLNGEKPFWATV